MAYSRTRSTVSSSVGSSWSESAIAAKSSASRLVTGVLPDAADGSPARCDYTQGRSGGDHRDLDVGLPWWSRSRRSHPAPGPAVGRLASTPSPSERAREEVPQSLAVAFGRGLVVRRGVGHGVPVVRPGVHLVGVA